jgi:hypothetical protein
MLKKYCQPISTRPDRMTAEDGVCDYRSFVHGLSFNSVCGWRESLSTRGLDANRVPTSLESALDGPASWPLGCRSRRPSAERRSSSMVAKSRSARHAAD